MHSQLCSLTSHFLQELNFKNPSKKQESLHNCPLPKHKCCNIFTRSSFLCRNTVMGAVPPPPNSNITRCDWKTCFKCQTILTLLSIKGLNYLISPLDSTTNVQNCTVQTCDTQRMSVFFLWSILCSS